MSVADEKIPPVPQLVSPIRDVGGKNPTIELGSFRFDNTWMQWFQQVKTKIDIINADLFNLSNTVGTGLASRDAEGTWTNRGIQGSASIDVANGDGVAGDPVISIKTTWTGQSAINTVGTITTGVWQGAVIGNTYLDAAPKMVTTATSATAGAATALPATPSGYVEVKIGAATKLMPYYD